MAHQTVTTDKTLEAVIAGGLANGENITINNGAVVTCTETPSVLIGSVTINYGELRIDGTSITSDNLINFVGEGGLISGANDQTIAVNGQGKLNITGDWFDIGTTDGTDSQVIDLSTATGVGYWTKSAADFCVDVIPMIQIETGRVVYYEDGTGILPEVGDWVYLSTDKTVMGKIKEVEEGSDFDFGSFIVWCLTGEFLENDDILVRKVVDNNGPDMQVSFEAVISDDDIKADGVYMEFGNARSTGVNYITSFGTGLGGLVFHHAFQGTDLILGGSTGGFKAPSGCTIRVPNVVVNTSSLVDESAGTPYASGLAFGCATNTNETEWYAIECTNGGEIAMSICNWGNAYTQDSGASKYDVEYSGFTVGTGSNIAGSKTTFDHVVVCQATEVNAIASLSCFGGVQDTVNGATVSFCMNIAPRVVNRNIFGGATSLNVDVNDCIYSCANGGVHQASNSCFAYAFTTVTGGSSVNNMYFGNNDVEQDYALVISTSSGITVENFMVSCTQAETPQTIDKDLVRFSNSSDISFVGMQFVGTGVPGGDVFYVTDVADVKIRAIGMIDDKIDLGTLGRSVLYISGLCDGIDIARVWFNKTTTIVEEFAVVPTSAKNVIVRNCSNKYASEVQISGMDTKFQGLHAGPGAISGNTGWEDSLVGSYGRSVHDAFDSDTTGVIACSMINPSPTIDNTTITSGNPMFYKDGDLDMASGDVIEFEQDYFALGHTGFSGTYTAATTTASRGANEWSNVTLDFQWMLKDGAWNGTWLDVRTATNWTGITGDIEEGVKLKFRFTATGTQNDMSILLVDTTTTLADQAANLYPIDQDLRTFSFTLDSALTGYEWRIYEVTALGSLAGANEVAGQESTSITTQSYEYIYTADQPIAVQIISQPSNDYVENTTLYTLGDTDQSVGIILTKDINN